MSKKKKDLEDNIDICSQKLERAAKLIGGLGGEKSRWGELASSLEGRLDNVTGDVLLAAATVSYLGALEPDQRRVRFDLHKTLVHFIIPTGETGIVEQAIRGPRSCAQQAVQPDSLPRRCRQDARVADGWPLRRPLRRRKRLGCFQLRRLASPPRPAGPSSRVDLFHREEPLENKHFVP